MDLHVQIVFDEGSDTSSIAKALLEIRESDPNFTWPKASWWHKPLRNPRAFVSRVFSRHGLRGKLSLMPHDGVGDASKAPTPRWTGFSPSTKRKRK